MREGVRPMTDTTARLATSPLLRMPPRDLLDQTDGPKGEGVQTACPRPLDGLHFCRGAPITQGDEVPDGQR